MAGAACDKTGLRNLESALRVSEKTKESIPAPSRATVVFQGARIRSNWRKWAVILSRGIHKGLSYLFGDAGTVDPLEYGDLGSYVGSTTTTRRWRG